MTEDKMILWVCRSCGHEVLATTKPNIKWTDGHRCSFYPEQEPTDKKTK